MRNKINKLFELCDLVEISQVKETFENLFELSQPWYKPFSNERINMTIQFVGIWFQAFGDWVKINI